MIPLELKKTRMLNIRSCRSSKRDRKSHRLRAQAAKRYTLADTTPAFAARSHTHVLVAVFPQQKVSNSAGDERVLTNERKFENILIYQDEFVSNAIYTGQLPVTAHPHTHTHTRKHTSITANTPAHTSSCINHPTFALCVQILALRRVCARAEPSCLQQDVPPS